MRDELPWGSGKVTIDRALSQLGQSVTFPSLWRPVFPLRPVLVEFVVDKLALGQGFSPGERAKSKQSEWAPKPVWMLRKRKLMFLPGMV